MPGVDHDGGRAVHRDAEEQVVGQLARRRRAGPPRGRVQRADQRARDATRCRARRTRRASPRTRCGDGGIGPPSGITSDDLRPVEQAARRQEVVHQQRRLARCRRALERRGGHRRRSPGRPSKPLEHVARREGAGHRVELVAALDQPGRRLGVEVGAQGDDEDVGVERPGVGLDASRDRVDGADRRPARTAPRGGTRSAYRCTTCRPSCGRTSRRAWRTRRRTRRPGRPASTSTVVAERGVEGVASSSPPKPAPRMRTRIRRP